MPLSQNVTIPLTLSLSTLGRHRYVIESVEDGVGNSFNPTSSPQDGSTHRSVEVIRRSSVSFQHCSSTHPIDLLKGETVDLAVSLDQGPSTQPNRKTDVIQSISVQFVPDKSLSGASPWMRDIRTRKGATATEMTFPARQPGEYTILGATGFECSGDVMSPEKCKVVQPPEPSAEVDLRPIKG